MGEGRMMNTMTERLFTYPTLSKKLLRQGAWKPRIRGIPIGRIVQLRVIASIDSLVQRINIEEQCETSSVKEQKIAQY